MSALFGHVKGAFTGAVQDRAGLLRKADGGVLFLDEIGELGAGRAGMLLRAIEEKRFLPVGSDREVRSDFQLIAGTNRDLRAQVAAGTLPRGPAGPHQPVDLPPARPARAPPRTSSPTSTTSSKRCGETLKLRLTFNPRRASASCASPCSPRRGGPATSATSRRGAPHGHATHGGRISIPDVDDEIARLRERWRTPPPRALPASSDPSQRAQRRLVFSVTAPPPTWTNSIAFSSTKCCGSASNPTLCRGRTQAVQRVSKSKKENSERRRSAA